MWRGVSPILPPRMWTFKKKTLLFLSSIVLVKITLCIKLIRPICAPWPCKSSTTSDFPPYTIKWRLPSKCPPYLCTMAKWSFNNSWFSRITLSIGDFLQNGYHTCAIIAEQSFNNSWFSRLTLSIRDFLQNGYHTCAPWPSKAPTTADFPTCTNSWSLNSKWPPYLCTMAK